MKGTYQQLAARICDKWQDAKAKGQGRLIIALAGPPGSGKSTIAEEVVALVEKSPDGPSIKLIPADGFHLPLSVLRSLPNAKEALERRGAHWTFDAVATVDLVRCLRNNTGRTQVLAPTFDHAVKDPVLDSLVVDIDTEVCIIEGNYVLVDEAPWSEISSLVDDRWLVTVDKEVARQRVASRHLKAGIESTLHDTLLRVDNNDSLNGEYIMEHSLGKQDLLVESIEEAR
ncbi:unnamed protein product [Clonostachys byssicola]|uniref:Phosphoribulokinase/uridine kinase domain-containing protein n=1 Tax=Clonostachys byssicola TaxID=160290 RepID=A0A9N9UK35_9HYPO|nr:unnamed protein product [Clonostachys byssicola]